MADVWFAPSYLGIVLFLFGITSTYLAYLGSLFASMLITFADAESLQTNLNTLQYTLGLISPSGKLLRVLLVSLNQSQYDNGKPYPLPFTFGRNRQLATPDDENDIKSIPSDVRDETARVEESEDKLKVLHLEKTFRRYKAVDDVTFGVDGGEKLALLGPNGAGKTTTISLIRGELRPSSRMSDVLISGLSIRSDQLAARRLLGVCPQFNTMDLMTVHEHLAFYARAHGMPDVRSNVTKIMDAVGLSPYSRRMTGKLSGGNQRKLSLATAIIGNPPVLLLDEPSTGMDAVAMRVMWKAVGAICAGRAIIITTHSMEEASALSDRTAIVDQRLLTIDRTSELTKRHAAGFYHVHIGLANGPASTAAEMQKVRDSVASRFNGATIRDRLFPDSRGQLRFQISTTNTSSGASSSKIPSTPEILGREDELKVERNRAAAAAESGVSSTAGDQLVDMLNALESEKERLGIGYYTIGQATLEDIFLDVIQRNRAL
ncbi:MAG: hypothetical protein LQ346_004916 [Caloplaca aetnensis]|nr:MAG: hypothetical protein LQ346_004916 [Caloplaca aetnensis]